MCYGLSKMSIVNEMAKGPNPYKKLLFVEFLEFIGRVAAEKYKDCYDWKLYEKIEKILDDVLPMAGYRRRDMARRIDLNT